MTQRSSTWLCAGALPAMAVMAVVLWPQSGIADGGSSVLTLRQHPLRIAQLPRYSASGMHQCGQSGNGKRSCVVSGLFSDCNEAAISLRTRDCCPTTKDGGNSTGFALSYCIPDISGR
jgi:hypothetical protein